MAKEASPFWKFIQTADRDDLSIREQRLIVTFPRAMSLSRAHFSEELAILDDFDVACIPNQVVTNWGQQTRETLNKSSRIVSDA